jgi:hypothetical protein
VENKTASIVRPWHALAYPFPLSLLKSISKSIAAKTRAGVEALGAVPFSSSQQPTFKKGSDRRLRVAYISYCFSGHPTSFLLSGIFRHHSKPRFHSLCFALNADDGAEERKRIEQVCIRPTANYLSSRAPERSLRDCLVWGSGLRDIFLFSCSTCVSCSKGRK